MILSQKLGIVGGSIIVFSVVFGFLVFDQILRFGIRDQICLRRRNEIRKIYLKLPFPLDFRVYFFNVSNPMEVQTGAIPILQEIGPYSYDEYIQKIDVVDDDGDDSLTYSPYNTFKFNQEKSGQLKDDDYVTVIHPLIMGIVNQVTRDSPALLPIVNKAISLLYPDLQSVYLTAKVKDILFDGIAINCKLTDFPAKALCTQLKSRIPGLKIAEDGVYLFSILGPRNATLGKRVKVSRGISKSKNLGKVLEVDGKREINLWGTKDCNTFKGTDSWIFPPLLTPEDEVWGFSTDLCRNIGSTLVENTVVKGIKVRRYVMDLGDMDHNEEDKCYCSTPKTCLKKGVFDLSKCLGVPIYATLPHFLRTDEIYFKQVEGMHPVSDDHIIDAFFEPMTSTPIAGHKRLQFNFPIAPNSKISFMKSLPEALHPLFWIEESVDLEGPLLKKVTNLFLVLDIISVLRWIGIGVGIIIIAYGTFDYFKDKEEGKITPVHHMETVSNSLTERSSSRLSINEDANGKRKVRSILNGHEFDRY